MTAGTVLVPPFTLNTIMHETAPRLNCHLLKLLRWDIDPQCVTHRILLAKPRWKPLAIQPKLVLLHCLRARPRGDLDPWLCLREFKDSSTTQNCHSRNVRTGSAAIRFRSLLEGTHENWAFCRTGPRSPAFGGVVGDEQLTVEWHGSSKCASVWIAASVLHA